jgi:uncharacterized protein
VAAKLRKCLICQKPTQPGDRFYPFCSERCKLIDLGAWSSEAYVISRPLTEADEELNPTEERPQGPNED